MLTPHHRHPLHHPPERCGFFRRDPVIVSAWPIEVEIYYHRQRAVAGIRVYVARGISLHERAELVAACHQFNAAVEIGTHGLFAAVALRYARALAAQLRDALSRPQSPADRRTEGDEGYGGSPVSKRNAIMMDADPLRSRALNPTARAACHSATHWIVEV